MSAHYLIRPLADRDLEDQAYYLAVNATPKVGHRFLTAAHETFALLATHPKIGWHPRLKLQGLESVRVFPVSRFRKMLIFYRPTLEGIEVLRVIHGSRNLQALLQREPLE